MDKFRYGISVSALFDDELNDEAPLPDPATPEGTEATQRLAAYELIRRELRRIFLRDSEVPPDVERGLFERIGRRRYKLLQPRGKRTTFSLLDLGRNFRRRMRNGLR